MAFVGKVASVQSEIALTLTANAAVAMANESYVALRADADYNIPTTASINKVGFLNATYAGRQWYLNNGAQFDKTSRLWFSDTSDPEALDLSDFDGDWDDITSSSTANEPIVRRAHRTPASSSSRRTRPSSSPAALPRRSPRRSSRTTARSAACRCRSTAAGSSGRDARASTTSTACR
jgi:hypothetical protein